MLNFNSEPRSDRVIVAFDCDKKRAFELADMLSGHAKWVKVGMTIEGLEHIEYLPVMDYRNQSIPLEKVTSMDVNKAIQRGLVKAIARHGLGLYIYANEDLPDMTEEQKELEAEKQRLREIQPLIKRAEQLGYKNIENLKTKTKKERKYGNCDITILSF